MRHVWHAAGRFPRVGPHGPQLDAPMRGLVRGMREEPVERRELLVAPEIEIRGMEPQMEYAAALRGSPQTGAQLGTGDYRQDPAARAVAAHQEHRFRNVYQLAAS